MTQARCDRSKQESPEPESGQDGGSFGRTAERSMSFLRQRMEERKQARHQRLGSAPRAQMEKLGEIAEAIAELRAQMASLHTRLDVRGNTSAGPTAESSMDVDAIGGRRHLGGTFRPRLYNSMAAATWQSAQHYNFSAHGDNQTTHTMEIRTCKNDRIELNPGAGPGLADHTARPECRNWAFENSGGTVVIDGNHRVPNER
eukprot:CAMPEP_0115870746 /NCGR_PEP_ID=MMETSP0287-20121206/22495_1 /TAXON_ID=412157 /ORGANISM="Chrysochromulina rotalis, Strain UIO044" /LENGTH=200 /DNA_ID=CAMNT_0003325497 /DNA_START=30 /DNA_END=630 /DNA_ORIENTATION=+